MTDARTLNWRFVVPGEPPGLLLLPVDDESTDTSVRAADDLDDLLGGAPRAGFPAVVAADLPAWTGHGGRRESARLLARLCDAVAPGGWVCVGFANPRYPGSAWQRAPLRLGAVRRVLGRSGIRNPRIYGCLPGHRHPGLLVPLDRAAELDYVLRTLFFTYTPADASWPRLRRRVLGLLRHGLIAAPHRLRRALVPGYLVVGERPA
jgi:hypothetical protein